MIGCKVQTLSCMIYFKYTFELAVFYDSFLFLFLFHNVLEANIVLHYIHLKALPISYFYKWRNLNTKHTVWKNKWGFVITNSVISIAQTNSK